MNPRLKRLQADYERIRAEFDGNPALTVQPVRTSSPPERYIVTYRVPGLRWNEGSRKPVIVEEHVAEIYLHIGYPREKPKCVMKTAIWHPNFGKDICIGDYWAAGETLADIIVQIGDMIQYKAYNTKSPVNKDAALWAEKHRDMFPLGQVSLLQPRIDIGLGKRQKREQKQDVEIILKPKSGEDIDIELK